MHRSYRLLLLLAFCSVVIWFAAFSSAPAAPGAKNAGSLYLLTITVGTHDPKGTPDDWNYTAKELEGVVKAHCGPLFREVKSNLVGGSQATPRGVLQALEWLQTNVKEQDLALLYIGSHGGSNAQRGFCMFANGGPVFGDQIKPVLARIKGRVVLVIQACHSGDLVSKHRKDLLALPKNVAAVCACRANQISHGRMLPPILEGLHGWADANKDGVVTVGEFLHYVAYRISCMWPTETQEAVTAEPEDFDLSTPLAKVEPKKLGQEVVLVEVKGDWWGGIVLHKKDPANKGRRLIHFFADQAGDEDWVVNKRICPNGLEPVIVKTDDHWYPAALLSQDGNHYRIHYVGVLGNREDTVSKDRILGYTLTGPPKPTPAKKGKKG